MKWKFWKRPKEIGPGIFTPEQVSMLRPMVCCKVVKFAPETEDGVVRATLEISLPHRVSTKIEVRVWTKSYEVLHGRTIPATWGHCRSGLQVTALLLGNLSPDSNAEGWAPTIQKSN